ncbi:MAG: pseudouridine synthase [Lachnospiraceae bacterium]
MADGMRLNKFMAQSGLCSRREADKYIEAGQVYINGQIASVGQTVRDSDKVTIGAKQLKKRDRIVVLAWYKPTGITCTEKDPHAKRKIADVFKYPIRVTYAGRLDQDSEGLLLMTNDGDLIQGLMKGANRHEKEYIVKVDKEIDSDFIAKMQKGVYLKELDVTTRTCEILQEGKYTFRIILTQGLNRQIRRMSEACGRKVVSLKRVRVENILLGALQPGAYREIEGKELKDLYDIVNRNKGVSRGNE